MFELIHAVITSLLLSAAMGGGVDKSAESNEEPANSREGIDVGTMPAYLVSPRGLTKAEQDEDDDHQPTASLSHASFREPEVCVGPVIVASGSLPCEVAFSTAGRSP